MFLFAKTAPGTASAPAVGCYAMTLTFCVVNRVEKESVRTVGTIFWIVCAIASTFIAEIVSLKEWWDASCARNFRASTAL